MTTSNPRTDPQEVGQRIEELLSRCAAHADPAVAETAEELARLLMGMYGAGLERIVALLAGAGQPGHRVLAELVDDGLVSALLVLHDLHPEDTTTRVGRALESVRPYLGSHAGDVELVEVVPAGPTEPDGAVVRLALKGSCDGCPSSAVTVKTAIEKAIEELCPEVARVEVEDAAGMVDTARGKPTRELPVLQIGVRQPEEPGPEVPVAWVVLDPPPLRPGQCAELEIAGLEVLLALPAGANAPDAGGLVAYRDECPSCHRPLTDARLSGNELTCANCAVAFDVRLAGRALDGSDRHLDPLPLMQRAGGWRLAVPRPTVGASA